MSDINDFYPFKKDGSWHNGAHITCGADIATLFPGQLIAYRNAGKTIYCDNDTLKQLSEHEYKTLCEEYKKLYKQENNVYKQTQEFDQKDLTEISKILGFEASADFLLFKHTLFMGENEFAFYALYMHLDVVSDNITKSKELSENICVNTDTSDTVTFPREIIAQEGGADGKVFYQKEYFIPKNITDKILNDTHFFLSGNKCCKITGDVPTYNLSYNNEHETQSFEQGTYFTILEYADTRRYPDVVKVEPLFIPIEIKKWTEEQNSKKPLLPLSLPPSLRFFMFDVKIAFLLNHKHTTIKQSQSIWSTQKIELTKVNGNEECKSIELKKLMIPNFNRNEIFLRAEDYKQYEPFYVRLKPSVFKEIYYEKNRTLYLKKRAKLDTYKVHPQLVCKAESKGTIHISEPIRIKKSDIAAVYEKDDVRFEKIKGGRFNAYYKYNENFIKLPADFTDLFENITKDFCFLRKDELKELDEIKGSDAQEKKSIKLLAIIKNKGGKSEKSCAFEHECEWNKKSDSSVLDIRARFIRKRTAIWDENCTNKELPEDIRECSSFTYFYHSEFEHFLRKLHKKYAENLILAQQIVMHKWMYKQGNAGLYPEQWDKDKPEGFAGDDQTFCNHAVFETIIRVDGNFTNFTNRKNKHTGKAEDEIFPDCPAPKEYEYRASNYWCDVLEKQSENSAKTGIYKLTARQAFYMAQLGYAVIASWKNPLKKNEKPNENHSPHFVTVVPKDYETPCPSLEDLMVAHVGGKYIDAEGREHGNEERMLISAFYEQIINDICFYCNLKQNFM